MSVTDPMERIIAAALDAVGEPYLTDYAGGDTNGLDFYLPTRDLYIEVKRMHSPRISEQMSRAPNVIAIQGIAAAEWVAGLIRSGQLLGANGEQESDGRSDTSCTVA